MLDKDKRRVYDRSMDMRDTSTLLADAPTPEAPDPIFAAFAAHTPRLTCKIVRYATGWSLAHWKNLQRGQVNWAWSDLRAVAPLLGETPAALGARLEASARYVRPDEKRRSPRHTCPNARHKTRHPSAPAPERAA